MGIFDQAARLTEPVMDPIKRHRESARLLSDLTSNVQDNDVENLSRKINAGAPFRLKHISDRTIASANFIKNEKAPTRFPSVDPKQNGISRAILRADKNVSTGLFQNDIGAIGNQIRIDLLFQKMAMEAIDRRPESEKGNPAYDFIPGDSMKKAVGHAIHQSLKSSIASMKPGELVNAAKGKYQNIEPKIMKPLADAMVDIRRARAKEFGISVGSKMRIERPDKNLRHAGPENNKAVSKKPMVHMPKIFQTNEITYPIKESCLER